ncbi:hypothetical protein [Sulfurovum sp.]|uniref:hypothetical protein n=1 Tax=Sulfurovum sp. TaxID=1969726 RepID=UPI00356907D4
MEYEYIESDWIYDLESYPNIFTMCVVHSSGKWMKVYEISDRKNEIEGVLKCLRYFVTNKCRMVGFNNIGYDYTLIHEIITAAKKAKKEGQSASVTANELYKLTTKIIKSMKDEKFSINVREVDHVIPQVDLFKIHHFDNKARSTSLKMLEFNMRSDEIDDLPFPVGKYLNDSEKDVLVTYNKKDVTETLKFYRRSIPAINLREELTEKFGFDCTNFNDTKIGKELFIRSLEKESPGCCYSYSKRGRTIKQTKRDKIIIKDCLFPYIKFDRPEFKAVHEWFKRQVITETKGVFSDLLEHNLGNVAKYAEMKVKKVKFKAAPTEQDINEVKAEFPLGWVEETELKAMEIVKNSDGNPVKESYIDDNGKQKTRNVKVPKKSYHWCYNIAETLNVVINGFRFDYGVGGIHGAKQGTVKATETKKLKTLDVASYYPNMAIANQIYPEHLGKTFCKVYKQLYQERKRHAKGSAANNALKLALNGTYGDSNNEFSPLYDPKYTMSITIGGQLSLCMLMEKLIDQCSAEIIMCNTDGFEYLIESEHIPVAEQLVKEWEELTGLQMEGDDYDVMYIRDVNNYVSITESGKVKTKGAYEVLPYDQIGWHKNQSSMVIAQAVLHELLGKGGAEDYIRNHKDPYDFMLRTKVPRSSSLVLVMDDITEIELQNICRYYPSTKGGSLVKIMPPLIEGEPNRRLGIDTEWKVLPCNKMVDFDWNINYDYYISAATKLLDGVK